MQAAECTVVMVSCCLQQACAGLHPQKMDKCLLPVLVISDREEGDAPRDTSDILLYYGRRI